MRRILVCIALAPLLATVAGHASRPTTYRPPYDRAEIGSAVSPDSLGYGTAEHEESANEKTGKLAVSASASDTYLTGFCAAKAGCVSVLSDAQVWQIIPVSKPLPHGVRATFEILSLAGSATETQPLGLFGSSRSQSWVRVDLVYYPCPVGTVCEPESSQSSGETDLYWCIGEPCDGISSQVVMEGAHIYPRQVPGRIEAAGVLQGTARAAGSTSSSIATSVKVTSMEVSTL